MRKSSSWVDDWTFFSPGCLVLSLLAVVGIVPWMPGAQGQVTILSSSPLVTTPDNASTPSGHGVTQPSRTVTIEPTVIIIPESPTSSTHILPLTTSSGATSPASSDTASPPVAETTSRVQPRLSDTTPTHASSPLSTSESTTRTSNDNPSPTAPTTGHMDRTTQQQHATPSVHGSTSASSPPSTPSATKTITGRLTLSNSPSLPATSISRTMTSSPVSQSAVTTREASTAPRASSSSMATQATPPPISVPLQTSRASPAPISPPGPVVSPKKETTARVSQPVKAIGSVFPSALSSVRSATPATLRSRQTTTPLYTVFSTTMNYSDESRLVVLFTVICSVTGVTILSLLGFLIYQQHLKWRRQRATGTRTLGVVNRTFFNADMLADDEIPPEEFITDNSPGLVEQRPDILRHVDTSLQVQSVISSHSSHSQQPTSGYSSSVESLATVGHSTGAAEQASCRDCPPATPQMGKAAQATEIVRRRAMTDDSGYDQDCKEDAWESGPVRLPAADNLPITTQHVFSNFDSDSDLDLTSEAVGRRDRHTARRKPVKTATAAERPQHVQKAERAPTVVTGDATSGSDAHKSSLNTLGVTYDYRPVVNSDGIIVRTARFPSKTSSQFSNSDHDSDQLLPNG